MVPCAEMVAFGKNGSDAVTAAVRVARAVTGREVILQYGFHGFHDWYVVPVPERRRAIPKVLRALVHPFPYNDLDALEALFERPGRGRGRRDGAGRQSRCPSPATSKAYASWRTTHGALLVFDEMVTGFRLANGGAQEMFGVVPDLACFGKAIANGMPLSAVVGRREYMRELPNTAYGMTFRGETLSLAAARTVLRILRREPVSEHVASIGSQLRDGFADACAELGVRAELIGAPARMSFAFHPDGGIAPDTLRTFFLRECASNGVLTNGLILPMYSHDAEAVKRTLEGFARALEPLVNAVEPARGAVDQALRAGFESQSVRWAPGEAPGGLLEYTRVSGGTLELVGWMLSESGGLDAVTLVAPGGERHPAERFKRPDLAQAFPGVPGAEGGGFRASVPSRAFARDGVHRLELVGVKDGSTVFRCPIEHAGGSSSSALPTVSWSGEALVFDRSP